MKFLLDENVPNNYREQMIKSGLKDIKRINDFVVGRKVKNKYKEVVCKYKIR